MGADSHTLQVPGCRGAGGGACHHSYRRRPGSQLPPVESRVYPLGPMPWNDERLRELHFPCAFCFEHQGSVLTLICSHPGPSPTCPGQNRLSGGGSQTHAPPLISVPCSTLLRELAPATSSLLSCQSLSSAVFLDVPEPRGLCRTCHERGTHCRPWPQHPCL